MGAKFAPTNITIADAATAGACHICACNTCTRGAGAGRRTSAAAFLHD